MRYAAAYVVGACEVLGEDFEAEYIPEDDCSAVFSADVAEARSEWHYFMLEYARGDRGGVFSNMVVTR